MAVARSQLPQVNLFDIPELMPGAQSSSTPAQRTSFEERCQKLYEDDVEEAQPASYSAAGSDVTVPELAAMFPSLDAELVQALAAEARTPYHALETLLALAAAVNEPAAPASPAQDLALENTDAFPSLIDADGWQVASQHMFDRHAEEDLGSAWRDRAKAAASKPAPAAAIATPTAPKRRPGKKDEASRLDHAQAENDYEFRQRLGKQRVQNRARFSRRAVLAGADSEWGPAEPTSEAVPSIGDEDGSPGAQNVATHAI